MNMDTQLLLICALTFVIHVIGTLAYAASIAGVQTGRIAMASALFNSLGLLSRTANAVQAPLLAKRIEGNLLTGALGHAEADFRWLILATALATFVGGLFIPTFHRMLSAAIVGLTKYRSMPQLMLHAFSRMGVSHLRESVRVPKMEAVTTLRRGERLSLRIVLANVFVTAIWTVGVLSALYAGYLAPELRVTASSLSALVNGIATIVLFLFVDPYLSILTDDVLNGYKSEAMFRRSVVWLIVSRFVGNLAAQVLLIPAAYAIVTIARAI